MPGRTGNPKATVGVGDRLEGGLMLTEGGV
jgi:hypothetical protein